LLAMDWAAMVAKQFGRVTIYPTYVFSFLPDAAALDVGRTGYKEVTEDWAKEQMAALQKKLPKEVICQPVYAKGNPAEEIVEICRLKGIDLIVMTTHGRKGISHLLHPSVAEALVRSAPCPVLVLHMNRGAVEAVHQ
jgi:nucleotide-binding universal stress UspA family protein